MLFFREYLLNCLYFPDLTQGRASVDEKNLQVEDIATLEDKAEMNGEMYVVLQYLVTNDSDFVLVGFEAG